MSSKPELERKQQDVVNEDGKEVNVKLKVEKIERNINSEATAKFQEDLANAEATAKFQEDLANAEATAKFQEDLDNANKKIFWSPSIINLTREQRVIPQHRQTMNTFDPVKIKMVRRKNVKRRYGMTMK